MTWGSLEMFLAMGGHAPYVFGSYGVAALALAVESVSAWRRHRAAVLNARAARSLPLPMAPRSLS